MPWARRERVDPELQAAAKRLKEATWLHDHYAANVGRAIEIMGSGGKLNLPLDAYARPYLDAEEEMRCLIYWMDRNYPARPGGLHDPGLPE